MIVCVIEWGSETLREPSVCLAANVTDAQHWAANEMQDLVFDDGGEIDELRDTYRPHMTPAELRQWHEDMWGASTDAWVGVYALADDVLGEAELIGHASRVEEP